MMLSDEDLKRAISEGQLAIEPYNERSVRPAGVVLHLGELLLRPLPGCVVDVKTKVVPKYEPIELSEDGSFTLEPGDFILGHTYEAVTVGPKFGLLIEGRSTLARVGITIVQTAMLVYPGHRNRAVTLELANHGPNPVKLYPKMKIARAAIFELRTPTKELYDDTGKYRSQPVVGPPIFKDEFLNEN